MQRHTPVVSIMEDTLRLQVCICTLGQSGLERIASREYPALAGVEHVVCLQDPEGISEVPQRLAVRSDFRIVRSRERGISKNRNMALATATAPVAMITDDDVTYTAEDYLAVIEAFSLRPECDALSFMYRSKDYPKYYPGRETPWRDRFKNYSLSAIELAVRPERVKARIRFNEHFGFHTDFMGGEDDIFYYEAQKKGLDCRFVPVYSGRHDHASTSDKTKGNLAAIETKGAIIMYAHPVTWPLRLAAHLLRETGRGKHYRPLPYVSAWLRGIWRKARIKM